jgi:hypothetical protein
MSERGVRSVSSWSSSGCKSQEESRTDRVTDRERYLGCENLAWHVKIGRSGAVEQPPKLKSALFSDLTAAARRSTSARACRSATSSRSRSTSTSRWLPPPPGSTSPLARASRAAGAGQPTRVSR